MFAELRDTENLLKTGKLERETGIKKKLKSMDMREIVSLVSFMFHKRHNPLLKVFTFSCSFKAVDIFLK